MWKKVIATGLHGLPPTCFLGYGRLRVTPSKKFYSHFFTFCFCPLVVEVGSTVVLILFQCFLDFFFIFFIFFCV